MDHKQPDESMGSVLEEAGSSGKIEAVKKIGIDPTRDVPSDLLAQLLLGAGAEPPAQGTYVANLKLDDPASRHPL